METKIYFRDLDCYINASDQMKAHKLMCPDRCFDLSRFPTAEISMEMKAFIYERGRKLTPLSIRSELFPFNQLGDFLSERYPDIKNFGEIKQTELEKKAKMWLLKNNKNIMQTRYRTATGKKEVTDAELIKYIRKIYSYVNALNTFFLYEEDRWYLNGIPIKLRTNPTKEVSSISFEKIAQDVLREEVKKIIYIHLSQKALGTVTAEITAINRFSKYLFKNYPDVESLQEIDRELLEQYLIYTNTEEIGRKSYCKELCHLKELFITAGKVFENKELEELFYRDDIGNTPSRLYKVYSDSELKRLNAAITEGDEQIARALILHQLLGTRISETLTLKRNSVFKGKSGKLMLRICQIKTGRIYEKAINEDVKKLFDKACDYTYQKHGKTEYVFVTDKEPEKPMQYGRIQYQLMAMITKYDLRDDKGERFGVGTHIWRHCYGKKLTEMHVDDITIAKLMGHANTSSLQHYRRVGNEMLSDETRTMREAMDDMLDSIIKEWK